MPSANGAAECIWAERIPAGAATSGSLALSQRQGLRADRGCGLRTSILMCLQYVNVARSLSSADGLVESAGRLVLVYLSRSRTGLAGRDRCRSPCRADDGDPSSIPTPRTRPTLRHRATCGICACARNQQPYTQFRLREGQGQILPGARSVSDRCEPQEWSRYSSAQAAFNEAYFKKRGVGGAAGKGGGTGSNMR